MAALLPTPIDGCEQFTTKNKAMVREGVELSTDKVISPCDVMRCMRAVPEHMKTATARTRKFSMFAW